MSNEATAAEAAGARVRGVLAEKKISQNTAAGVLGLSPAAMSRRVSGEIPFNVSELDAIASLTGVPASRFLEVA